MKIIKIMVPLAIAAAGAAAALVMKNKKGDAAKPDTGAKATSEKDAKKKEKVITDLRSGTYSFMSGYTDARQVELTLDYDGETTSFDVVEDEFLCYSSDSHVVVMRSEDFSLQIEYAEFFSGEDYDKFKSGIADKYAAFKEIILNCGEACSYISGDSLCVCVPTALSYVLISVIPAKGSKETPETLSDNYVLKAILNSIRVEII